MLNEIKLKYLLDTIGFHSDDFTMNRQMELNARIDIEGKEWVLVALSEDTFDNWEKYGFNLMDKPDFRKRVSAKLKALEREDDKAFARGLAQEYKKKGFYIPEEVARKRYYRIKEHWDEFLKGERFVENNHTYRMTYNAGATDTGIANINHIMASTTRFEELTQLDWFALLVITFVEIVNPAHLEGTPVLSIDWHRLTDFRRIEDVYNYARETYDEWERMGLIPYDKCIGTPLPQPKDEEFFFD